MMASASRQSWCSCGVGRACSWAQRGRSWAVAARMVAGVSSTEVPLQVSCSRFSSFCMAKMVRSCASRVDSARMPGDEGVAVAGAAFACAKVDSAMVVSSTRR